MHSRRREGLALLVSLVVLALALGLGCLALYYMRLYAGSWAALGELDVTDFWLHVTSFDPLQFKLTLGAVGQRVQSYDVTEPLAVFSAAYVSFLVVQGLISAISGAIWRGSTQEGGAFAGSHRPYPAHRGRAAPCGRPGLEGTGKRHQRPSRPDAGGLQPAVPVCLRRLP